MVAFDPRQDFAAGPLYATASIGDLDGDGKPDIIVTGDNPPIISVLRNTSLPGAISFAGQMDFSMVGGPYGVAIWDLDGDGKADVAVMDPDFTKSLILISKNNSAPGELL